MGHVHFFKKQGMAMPLSGGRLCRVGKCRCGEYRINKRKPKPKKAED